MAMLTIHCETLTPIWTGGVGQQSDRLHETGRRGVADQVLQRLEKVEAYEGKRVPLRIIIQEEARRLTTYLRGERGAYEAFAVRW